MPDPTPLLTATTGASAGLVAIIGGLLVARYVGLDSEQQGAQRLLDDARVRLEVAQRRHDAAKKDVLDFEATELLSDPDVLEAIVMGTTDTRELRLLHGAELGVSDEALEPLFEDAHREATKYLYEAEEILREDEPADSTPEYWDEARLSDSDIGEIMANVEREGGNARLWVAAYEYLWQMRHMMAETRQEAKAENPEGLVIVFPPVLAQTHLGIRLASVSNVQSPNSSPRSTADRRMLVNERERSAQGVEDTELEVRRFQQLRNAVVKPKGIWPVLGVLIYASLVGIVLPVWKMATAPKDFDWQVTTLAWLFGSALLSLVGVMIWQAWRLSRSKS